jgi:hypothetical protein
MNATGRDAALVWLLFLVVGLMVALAMREVLKGLWRQAQARGEPYEVLVQLLLLLPLALAVALVEEAFGYLSVPMGLLLLFNFGVALVVIRYWLRRQRERQ